MVHHVIDKPEDLYIISSKEHKSHRLHYLLGEKEGKRRATNSQMVLLLNEGWWTNCLGHAKEKQ